MVAGNGSLEVEVADLAALNRLVDRLRADRLLIAEVSPMRAALEDVFIEVVKGETRAGAFSDPGPRTPDPGAGR